MTRTPMFFFFFLDSSSDDQRFYVQTLQTLPSCAVLLLQDTYSKPALI